MEHDQETERVTYLLERTRRGSIEEAEREELALYLEERPELAEQIARAERDRGLGSGWLERVDGDYRLRAAEKASVSRRVGFALAGVGFVGMIFTPAAGVALALGVGLLAWSAIRIRVVDAVTDPYEDIEQ